MEVSFKEDIPATQPSKEQQTRPPLSPPRTNPGATNGPNSFGSLVIGSLLGSALLLSIWQDYLFFKELISAFLIIGIVWSIRQVGQVSVAAISSKQTTGFKPTHPHEHERAAFTPDNH